MDFIDFSDILTEVTQDESTRFITIKEVAYVMGCSTDSVYAYRKGRNTPNVDDVRALHHYLVKEHDNYIVLRYLNPAVEGAPMIGKTGSVGQFKDNLLSVFSAATDLQQAYKNKDQTSYDNALSAMRSKIHNLKLEIE